MTVKQKNPFSFRKPAGVCLGQAPHIDLELFVGRQRELELIAEKLRPKSSSHEQRRVVLGGKGGIGKTQLALAYAKRHHAEY